MSTNSRELDFSRLRARRRERPRTKVGQVRQAWPEIRALIAAGHSLKDIWTWVNEIGIEIGYARLSHYVGQLKRRDVIEANINPETGARLCDNKVGGGASVKLADLASRGNADTDMPDTDPLANFRARQERPAGFKYSADLDLKKLI